MKKILLLKADMYKADLIKIFSHFKDTYHIDSYTEIPPYDTVLTYDLIISTPVKFPYILKKACFIIINDVNDLDIIEKTFYTQIINGKKFYTSCAKALELIFKDYHEFIEFKGGVRFPYHDIVYLSHCNRHVIVKTKFNEYTMRGALRNYEYLLDNYRFFKSHSSFIVNIAYVDYIQDDLIYLKDGSTVPISRKFQNSEYITYFRDI